MAVESRLPHLPAAPDNDGEQGLPFPGEAGERLGLDVASDGADAQGEDEPHGAMSGEQRMIQHGFDPQNPEKEIVASWNEEGADLL